MGMVPDREVAERFGVSIQAVGKARKRRNIICHRDRPAPIPFEASPRYPSPGRGDQTLTLRIPVDDAKSLVTAYVPIWTAREQLWNSVRELDFEENQDDIQLAIMRINELDELEGLLNKAINAWGRFQQ